MFLQMDAKTQMLYLIIMFAVRPICVQDSTFKMSSASPDLTTRVDTTGVLNNEKFQKSLSLHGFEAHVQANKFTKSNCAIGLL